MNLPRTCILLLAVACASPPVAPNASCTSCHGSATSPAPPNALGGLSDPSLRGIGAHQVHLTSARISDPVPCASCHLTPASVDAPGHIDDPWPADLTWGGLANADGAVTTWDGSALTCAGSYCHGGTLAGGTDTAPVWTAPSGAPLACDACHGSPPPAPHPPGGDCGGCHAPTATGGLITNPATHIDGTVQLTGVEPETCDTCHGANGDPAPPPDLDGNTDRASPGVGAHQAHLSGGSIGAALPCAACHPVPSTVDAPGHQDGVTDMVFTGTAVAAGVNASWDAGDATCTVYCHGASLQGDPPVWTATDGAATACGACHTMPPPPPHPGSASCSGCHGTAGPGPSITDPVGHIDGSVDF